MVNKHPFADDHALHDDAQALLDRRLHWSVRSVLYAVVVMILGSVAWATIAQVDRVVVAQGRLITTEPIVVVQPFEIGVIRSIDVAVGTQVKRGQTLISLDPTSAESSAGELSYRKTLLRAEVARLSAEADGRVMNEDMFDHPTRGQQRLAAQRYAEYAARRGEFGANIKRLEGQRSAAISLQRIVAERLEIARELEATRQQLAAKEVGTRLAFLQARSERLGLEEQLSNSVAQADDYARQIDKFKTELDAFSEHWQREVLQRLIEANRELETVSQQYAVASRRSEMVVLRAPTDGVVLEVAKRSVGSVVQPAETLVTLVPSGARIEAQVEIGTQDIGHVRPSDLARVKLDALPFMHHGTLTGAVRTISDDALPSDHRSDASRVYQTRISLDPPTLRNVPASFRLLPGMAVNAEVKVGTRTIASYFLHPLIQVFDETLREP
jgi:hemolysin D